MVLNITVGWGGGFGGKPVMLLLIFDVSCTIDFEMGHNCNSYLFVFLQHYLHTRGTTVYNLTTGRLVHIYMPISCIFFFFAGGRLLLLAILKMNCALLFCLLGNFVNYLKIIFRERDWERKNEFSLCYLV